MNIPKRQAMKIFSNSAVNASYLALAFSWALSACSGTTDETDTASSTSASQSEPSSSYATPTPGPGGSGDATPTPTPIVPSTPEATPTPAPTVTPTPGGTPTTPTSTPAPTSTPTSTGTPEGTPEATGTPNQTEPPEPTPESTPTATETPEPTPTSSETPNIVGAGGMAGNGGGSGDGGGSGGMGGNGGASNGGGGAGGSAGAGGFTPSTGCDAAMTTMPCSTSGSPCTLDISGTEREFYVVLPNDYEPTRPYPVVFQFHPLGGNAEQGMNMYGVRQNFPNAIYVTPQGLMEGGGTNRGWANTSGRDTALTRAIVADIEAKYCIDRSRYFSTGFSYGGSMSFTAAMCMSDIFRAIAPMAGAPISGAGQCTPERPVAAWISHGEEDELLPMNLAIPLRDALVTLNGCSSTTVPVDPSPCVAYQGCDDGYPVIWGQQPNTGHTIPNYSRTTIAEFFQQF